MATALFETEVGNINIEFFSDDAPNTVKNFKKLISDGFYDGLAFHRVIPGFMAQGGCPNTRDGASGMPGTGGPGYNINCEINSNKHLKGSLSMAHAGRNTGGSQFFIVYEPQPHLDGVHTVFGKTDDMDVVLKLTNGSKILKATLK
ncbi:Peptidyl-prolyl cis-trans isomerase [Prochlorococcus marinus str. MIT 9201]|uniref:Peptidyl-prolyl cis-trans isomerase n=1 Tax=Prochlorococcus marinus str. MIT 9201 TaxID=93057 RepID=A0A0A2AA71_PROMR|nr:peptidylprolyl isomerase [Prochlorococcus marinus]KGF97721.1 Peptidyl-prolyl cis-trans isomerase [Prochlorococcus marinus str. MIT 9201]